MTASAKGPAIVLGPEDGDSYWQPLPSRGYSTVKLSPYNCPFDTFAAGTQLLEPGAAIRKHGHQRQHELLFVYEGQGHAEIDGTRYPLVPETTIIVGRNVQHLLVNDGPGPMRLHWVIFPPGLEDWFAAIGKPRRPGEPMPEPFERPDDVGEIQRRQKFALEE